MKRIIVLISFLFTLFTTSSSFAWGEKGHSLVAEIAFQNLDATTKKNVLHFLNGMSIEEAANWMDSMRSDNNYDFMKPYHYINIDKNTTAKELQGDNIVNVLNKALKDLDNIKGLSDEEIRIKLFYIFHLVGDLHQPLHVGYKEDKGGNTVQVSLFGKGSNLHALWDSGIIEYKGLNLSDELKLNTYNATELAAIQKIDVIAWMKDSRGFLKNAYSLKEAKVSDYYIDANYPIIKQQILKAGLRLASILEHYFKNITIPSKIEVTTIAPIIQTTEIDIKEVTNDVVETPTEIDIKEATNYEGKLVRICSKIYGTKYLDSSSTKPTFLNVGANYPNSLLTIVILDESRKNFNFKPEEYYNGKDMCVTGKIKMHKGKPEIIINNQHAIEIK